jgi:type I restriction enzyme S subunit
MIEIPYGSFPEDYQLDRLEDLCIKKIGIQTGPFGSQLHNSDYVSIGTPILTVEHLGENRILHENLPRVTEGDRQRLSRYSIKKGDIIFSRVGSVDRRALVREAEDGWLFSGRCLRVRPDPDKLDSVYLSYIMGLPSFKEYIRKIAVGATMPSINTEILSDIPICYPPLPTQHTIACILGSLDDKIELNRQMNETLEAMARAIFQSWFVDFDPVRVKAEGRDTGLPPEIAALFPDGFEEVSGQEVPRGWEVCDLKEICKITRGSSPRPIQEYMNGTIPWIKIADVTKLPSPFLYETRELLKEEGISNSVEVHPGDIVLSNSATCGVPVFIEIYGCIHDGWLLFRDIKRISKGYLYHNLIEMSNELVRIADGSVQKNLNIDLMGMQAIVVPSQNVLQKFDEMNEILFKLVRSNVEQSRTLAKIRDALLPKLMSGEIQVKAET